MRIVLNLIIMCAIVGWQAPAWADNVESNDFGVVNPWPGVGDVGADWCRCGGTSTILGSWNRMAESPDQINWTNADSQLQQIENEGMLPLPILSYTPKWAAKDKNDIHSPPKDPMEYYQFVKKLAERYRGRIPAYEIWNEPNSRGIFFAGGEDDLVELIKIAACAIRDADPKAKIVFPGLAGNDAGYLRRCYELGVGGYFDIMATHPYQWSKYFRTGHRSVRDLSKIRDVLDEHGDENSPIWLTEFGWEVKGRNNLSEDDQARLLVAGMTYMRTLERIGVTKIFWYSTKSWNSDFGLIKRSGKPRRSFYAYQTLVDQLEKKKYVGRFQVDKAQMEVFAQENKPKNVTIVAWASGSKENKVELPFRSGTKYDVITIDGESRSSIGHNLIVKPEPVFIRVSTRALQLSDFDRAPRSRRWDAVESWEQDKIEHRVWAQIKVPEGTRYAYITRDNETVDVQVWNLTPDKKSGKVYLRSEDLGLNNEQAYTLAPMSHATLQVPVKFNPKMDDGMYDIRIDGSTGDQKIESYTDKIYLSDGKTIQWRGNSYIETLYLTEDKPAGGTPGVSFGNKWTYHFDLSGEQMKYLELLVGATGHKQWRVLLSTDGENFKSVAAGKSWPSWRRIKVPDRYQKTSDLFVRIKGNDCQLRSGRLVTVEKP